jgi:hypothetical protein
LAWLAIAGPVLIVVVAVAIALLPRDGQATFTMHGFLTTAILDPDGSDTCEGTSGSNAAADVSQGAAVTFAAGDQVTVTAGRDGPAVGALGAGQSQGDVCLFAVTVPVVPTGHAQYEVQVGSCAPFTVSARAAHRPVELRFPSGC